MGTEEEKEVKRISDIFEKHIFERGWINSCAVRASKLPIISGINAPYFPVLAFFDEANKCFVQGLHKGYLALCRSTLEAILEHKSGNYNSGLESLIDTHRDSILEPNNLYKDAKEIVSLSKPYAHADETAWSEMNRGLRVTFVSTAFEPTVGDEMIALKCLTKLRKIMLEIYGVEDIEKS